MRSISLKHSRSTPNPDAPDAIRQRFFMVPACASKQHRPCRGNRHDSPHTGQSRMCRAILRALLTAGSRHFSNRQCRRTATIDTCRNPNPDCPGNLGETVQYVLKKWCAPSTTLVEAGPRRTNKKNAVPSWAESHIIHWYDLLDPPCQCSWHQK